MPNFFTNFKKGLNKVMKDTGVTNARNKPDPDKNFFQNYSDHLDWLELRLRKDVNKLYPAIPDMSELSSACFFTLIDAKHLLMFDALRDGYDYMDEVLGATVVPLACAAASLGCLGLAIWEGAQEFAIKTGMKKDDFDNHDEKAVNYLAAAGGALAVAMSSLIKSLISLVTRPVITMIQGWKPQDTTRFYNEDSLENSAKIFADSFL